MSADLTCPTCRRDWPESLGAHPLAQLLTKREKEIRDAIKEYTNEKGYAPTQSELAVRFGLQVSTVCGHVQRLTQKGFIIHTRYRQRSLKVITGKDAGSGDGA